MIESLKHHLVILYTCVTGCILTAVVLTTALISFQSSRQKTEHAFTGQLMTIYQKLQYDNSISHSWLNEMESKNGLIIYIEENGKPLLYSGTYQTATDRHLLLLRARTAAQEQIDLSAPPVSTTLRQSSLLTIKGDFGDSYWGCVLVFRSRNSYYSLTLLMDETEASRNRILTACAFLLADLAGILCLLFANHRLVEHSLIPIRENEKKQQAFLAAASHELRSPLSVIQASAQAVQTAITDESFDSSNESEFLVNAILRECRRMTRLIQDMLLLTSSKANGWQMQEEHLDMDTLLLNLYESYNPVCKSHGMSLNLNLPDESLPPIRGDGQRMTQIFAILLDNSLAHSKSEGPLEISAVMHKHKIVISVIDHGCGIPKEAQGHIFEAFYRADTSRRDKQHFGLGLGVASELARRQGGHIYLKDTPGGGCTFCVEFPVNDER